MTCASWCLLPAGLGSCTCANGTPVCSRTLSIFNKDWTGPVEKEVTAQPTIVASTVEPLVLTNPSLRSFRRLVRGVRRQ